MTKLASGLPKGEANGLDQLARKLLDNPHEVHVVIALVDCSKIATNVDSGDVEPTARIRRVEAVSGDDKSVAATMLRRALERRTGQTVLPYDLEEDMRTVFGDFDPGTGEIKE
jgi:hypothetical protein